MTAKLTSAGTVRGKHGRAGPRPNKRLGQHFLIDQGIRDRIIEAAELDSSDVVIEVGPGLGMLTRRLVGKAGNVIAVEIDNKLALKLRAEFAGCNNFELINSDILKLDLPAVVRKYASYKVVANIPYYITSPILHYFIYAKFKPSLMVVMVQEEVARAITAGPGGMSFLSVSLQVYSQPEIICRVPAKSFYPPPKVESSVIRFRMLEKPAVTVDNISAFLDMVHAGFAAPRKQLRNSLALGLNIDPESAGSILSGAGINYRRRAETLTLGEWQHLYSNSIIADSKDER